MKGENSTVTSSCFSFCSLRGHQGKQKTKVATPRGRISSLLPRPDCRQLLTLFFLSALVLSCLCPSRALALQAHAAITGPFANSAEVNRSCAHCHQAEAEDIEHSAHGGTPQRSDNAGQKLLHKTGMNLSRFGLSIIANPKVCGRCHLYAQTNNTGETTQDGHCLRCHGNSNTPQAKEQAADLLNIARNVEIPSVQNCQNCHEQFCGLAPRHAPQPMQDVHIQRYGFRCQQCHPGGRHHNFRGRHSGNTKPTQRATVQGCASCHGQAPHSSDRLNQHAFRIACQSCHIPEYGTTIPVVTNWNWLLTNNEQARNPSRNSSQIGPGIFQSRDLRPQYFWDDGTDSLYTRGTKIQPGQTTVLQHPGQRTAPAKISPFIVQYSTQPYDKKYHYLISPLLPQNTSPFFDGSDWQAIIAKGMRLTRLPYSGQYDFTTTVAYRRLNHGVVPASRALGCLDCHGSASRLNWQQLGYEQDPWTEQTQRQNLGTSKRGKTAPQAPLPPIRETILPVPPSF